MQQLMDFLNLIDGYFGSSSWFAAVLLLTGLYFTIALKLPQFRLFGRGVTMLMRANRIRGEGDANTFGSLTTALSGTIGTGNIGGVAFALFLGGPAALFWMWMTAFVGMATKMAEVTLAHKYRQRLPDGTFSGGPMYVLDKGMNMRWLGILFAIATGATVIGAGTMTQMRSITDSVHATVGIDFWITSLVVAAFLAVAIIGGGRRIAQVSTYLVPSMSLLYIGGASLVIIINAENIIPSFVLIFSDIFSVNSAVGGFLGATFAQAFNYGVARGLFSNEAGMGSAPIAHAMARTDESVDEGVVALLEPMIDTLIICTLTGLAILASGVWHQKHQVEFSEVETRFLLGQYRDDLLEDTQALRDWIAGNDSDVIRASGAYRVKDGVLQQERSKELTILHARSIAEDVRFYDSDNNLWSGSIYIEDGILNDSISPQGPPFLQGRSLVHSVPLTIKAFESVLGAFGGFMVTFPLMLFAFSTMVTWEYYGNRSLNYVTGGNRIIQRAYQVIYLAITFIGGIAETTIVWMVALAIQPLMVLPNLFALISLRHEIKNDIFVYSARVDRERRALHRIRKSPSN